MEFVKETPKFRMQTISKSFAENYETCKLKAWKKKRRNRDRESRILRVGLAAHDLFSKKVADYLEERYEVKEITDPSIIEEAKKLTQKVDIKQLIDGGQILGYEVWMETMLPSGISMVGIADLVVLGDDEILGAHIHIIDYKTSHKISKEEDNEALFYIYLAAKKWGLPVVFTRFSGRTGDSWGVYKTLEQALALENSLDAYAREVQAVIESDEEPFPEASPACAQCPFLDECAAKEMDITNPRTLLAKLQLHKSMASQLERQLKELRFENEQPLITPEFKVDISESSSIVLDEGRRINKRKLLDLFVLSGEIEEISDALDIKITPAVAEKAKKAFGLKFKEKRTSRLKIEPIKATDEEASNE